jgi:DNA polymerase-3 subunit alpha
MPLREALLPENKERKIAACATVAGMEEVSYADKNSGETRQFIKIKLQQNSDWMELVCWHSLYREHKKEISAWKDKTVILTAVIKHSDYTGCNTLNLLKTSLLFSL